MTNKKEFIVFGSPLIEQEEINEVVSCLKSGWLGTGPKVTEFENNFLDYKKGNYVAALNSCTAALHLSLKTLDLKPGDEVITTAMTFCATVNAIIHSGATPVLADVEFDSMNINPTEIKNKITSNTKAILIVHFAGRPCNMDAIMDIAKEYNLKVIEDCAHAIETTYKNKNAGTFGDFGCFSFYVTKNITTGEGGMVIAREKKDIDRIKILGLHGMSKDAWKRFGDEGYKHYYVVEAGFKYNMMDIQAAIGIHQLKRIDSNWQKRQEIWQQYKEAFRNLPIILPADPETNTKHAYHLFTILIDEQRAGISRDDFLKKINLDGIGVGVHYLSIPEHPFYQKTYKWLPENYPNSYKIGRQTVSLPLSPKLTQEQINRVIVSVCNIFSRK